MVMRSYEIERLAILWCMCAAPLWLSVSAEVGGQPPVSKFQSEFIELNDQNYAAWRDHILPQQPELDWQQIPWLTTFKDGIIAANAADKPLLFWTMNGHPLGCT